MPSEIERIISLRRFDGTNVLLDSAYLGPTYLRSSQNWIPSDTFRLTKAPGTTAYTGGNIANCARVQALLRVYATDGSHRYLYAVVTPTGGGVDQLWVSTDDGAWARVQSSGGGNFAFASTNAQYSMDAMNGVLYVGNGHYNASVADPIVSVPFGGTATALSPVTSYTDSEAAASVTSDTGAQILTGTYSYVWCIFDHTSAVWKERGTTQTITNANAGDQALSFPVPTGFATNGGALSSRYRAHLFVSPVNYPVEFSHDQTPDGIQAGTTVLRAITADGQALPVGSSLSRTGRIFRWHRGRLWIAGDEGANTATWATSPLVPGLEQAIFNAGLFFPVNARLPRTPDTITGLGVCMTAENADPSAPLAVTTLSKTFLFYGDILDDPAAAFVQVSQKAGCIAPETMCETPFGLFYVGLRSVYHIPLGGGAPEDVGWPIRPSIEAIPVASRKNCRALFHKNFLKIAIVPPGGTTATVQWWLDLRRGLTTIPSWWGPHLRVAPSAWTVCDADPDEPDRAIHAVEGSGTIEFIHQLNTYTENAGAATIRTALTTGELDDGQPFEAKIWKRVRATGFPGATTTVGVTLSVDGGADQPCDSMVFTGTGNPGSTWNSGKWNTATWGTSATYKTEGESIFGDPAATGKPIRGDAAVVTLAHDDTVSLALRDIELRYRPIPRPTRVLAADGNS